VTCVAFCLAVIRCLSAGFVGWKELAGGTLRRLSGLCQMEMDDWTYVAVGPISQIRSFFWGYDV
jgi:hypothetical protein